MVTKRNIILDVARLIAMFFVMIIHSGVAPQYESHPVNFFLDDFISKGAVPFFFILSGFFFAKKMNREGVNPRTFLSQKWETLVVPFLFWNGFLLLALLTVKFLGVDSLIRGEGAYFDIQLSFSSLISALLGIGRAPIVYQFWFMRDLIVVATIVFFTYRYLTKVPLLPLFFFFMPLPMASSFGYFLLGCQLGLSLSEDKFPNVFSSGIYCVCWLLIGCLLKYGGIIGGSIPYPILQIGSAMFIFCLATIVVRFFPISHNCANLGGLVFFVYATHEPLQTAFSKFWLMVGIPFHGTILSFLLIPIFAFLICTTTYLILKRIIPNVIKFITGSR